MIDEIFSEDRLWLLLLMQGTACIALGLAGSYLLKRRAARAHQVLLIALLASVLMPASYLGVKHFGLGVLVAEVPGAPETIADLQPVDTAPLSEMREMEIESTIAAIETSEPAPMPSVNRTKTVTLPWRTILLTCWAAAALVLTARLALRFILGRHLLRNARPVRAAHMCQALDEARRRVGIAGPAEIRASNKVRSPVIWCWSHTPTLLMQQDALESIRPRDWVGVFCHELAHLKRLDHATGLFVELLICAAPWHPLTWWAMRQLVRLSEEACDDWVLAGGQIGVDYAESLLELSPQRELAFVPTVVGKEKTMKARIVRIVKDQCSNPRIGRRWALAVCAVAICLATGVAFAQRRPVERPRAERPELRAQEEQRRELMVAGRRNVLRRLLEQLAAQARETEGALRERGDDPSEDGQVQRAELEALREYMQTVERQLRGLEQDERPRPEPDEPRARREQMIEMEAHAEELARHRDGLAEKARHMKMELKELGDSRPEAREQLEMELLEIREQIEAVAKEQDNLRRDRARTEPRRTEVERVRTRETRERARGEAEPLRELSRRLRELHAHARETERHLEHIDDRDSAEAHELHTNLDRTHEEMIHVEEELQRLQQERGASARARGERTDRRPVERSRRASRDDLNREELLGLRRAHEGLTAQIRLTEEKLKNAEEQDSPAAKRLRSVLEQLHQRREALEREAGPLNDAPRERPGIEIEVEELRGQVNGMHEEMTQMREMLQQLLERRRKENEETKDIHTLR